MKCKACDNDTIYSVETKSYPTICSKCAELSISERQEKMLNHGMKQNYIRAMGKFGSIDFQPLERNFDRLVGYKMSSLIPDHSRKWVAVPNEEGTDWNAYLLKR